VTINLLDTNGDDRACGMTKNCVTVNSQLLVSVASPAGSVADRAFELHNEQKVGGREMFKFMDGIPDWLGKEVIEKLKVVLGEDAVRTSVGQPSL
jgi:hypothetical protein